MNFNNEKLYLKVKDNGIGITEDGISHPQSFGLMGIKEYCDHWEGILEIDGQQGIGTTVSIQIPLPKGDKK